MGSASCEACCSLHSFPWHLLVPLLLRTAGVLASLRLCWVDPPPPRQLLLLRPPQAQAQQQQLEKRPPSRASLASDSFPTTGDSLALDFSVAIQKTPQLRQLLQQPRLQLPPPPPPPPQQQQQRQPRQHPNAAVCLAEVFSAL